MNKRWCERKAVSIPVHVIAPDGDQEEGVLCNLAVEGAFVEISSRIVDGIGSLQLRMDLPTAEGWNALYLAARVIHHRPNGVGLMFEGLQPKVIRTLLALMQGQTGPDAPRGPISMRSTN